ncbi:hypothetical protein CLOSTMETH_02868 [[Clostridium] methylpentosum DSM 5476]|uniref:Uncharacterized protein n=1 Tax=[Clostridium] methylpentosum DSM 5476 TaxID=537013 RepID=C0EG75_9FIRM|nr:hypothetical protein CLOSTMETH_02868 [[Clostridium] methylpentosum DSM 5476]
MITFGMYSVSYSDFYLFREKAVQRRKNKAQRVSAPYFACSVIAEPLQLT